MTSSPKFEIPASSATVQVRVIDSTSDIYGPMNTMIDSPIKGHEFIQCPSFSFLVEHVSGRKVLFDLGLRKDWDNLAPVVVSHLKKDGWKLSVEKGVHEVLEDHGVDRSDVEAIIWSHWHYDHTGDPSAFPPSTALVVGPGFKDMFMPGYPANEDSPVLESDFAGREVKELAFPEGGPKIGNFSAIDYFGDGSFYVLDGPGHTIGHVCALARVTSCPDSFIFMGGDCCHHAGEIRPSTYLPLPASITPNPLSIRGTGPCPGAIFEHLLRNGDREKPFYGQLRPGLLLSDPDVAEQTIEKVQEADASKAIMVIIAHDTHLAGVIDFFPKYATDFMAKGWLEKTRWAFLKDFSAALSSKDSRM
ncbi:metallo-beta-lactamase superfamily protein [Ilyonectria robusta]